MKIRRAQICAFAVVAVTSVLATTETYAVSRAIDGRIDDWRGISSGFGGTSGYSNGEFVYADHIYDDLGADTRTRSQQHGSTGPPSGDYRYPADEQRYGNNAADLLELRLDADHEALWVLARMNTLKASDTTVIAIGLDSDTDPATGGGAWPYSVGLAVPGVDHVITLWGAGGTVTALPGGERADLTDVAADTSNDHNAIEARIPRSLIGDADSVRVWAATGLWDATNTQWMAPAPGSPTATAPGGGNALVAARAFNVAFRADETGSYMEELQGSALAAGNIEAFHVDIDLGDLIGGRDQPFELEPGRFYVAVMDQGLSIPPEHEGLSYDGVPGRFQGVGGEALAQSFDFYGRHQPYGIYVPSTYGTAERIAAALALHGHGGSHSTYNSQPGFLADMGEGDGSPDQPPMFLITPLARGSSFYADWGEADTLAVLDDVFERFPIDPDRLYITGYSMGGYGTYRLGSLYPDRFAAAAVWAGYTGEFTGSYLTNPGTFVDDPTELSDPVATAVRDALAPLGIGGGRQGKAVIGDPVDTLENLRHLPLVHLAGTNDEIVPTTGQYAAPRRLAELGYRSRFDLYPGYEHLTFAVVDDWKQVRSWLGNRTREDSPRTIDHRFSDGWTAPGLATELGLEHGKAWWLRDLSMRMPTQDGRELASVTATSHGIAAPDTTVMRGTAVAGSPTPHVQQLVAWENGQPLPVENRLDVAIAGARTLAVDTDRAGLDPCGLVLGLRSDGEATMRLTGPFPASASTPQRSGVSSHVEDRSLVVQIDAPIDDELLVTCGGGASQLSAERLLR